MKQEQSAGDHSRQYQAGRDVHVHGVTAADVVEITRSEVGRIREELTAVAEATASERLQRLESRILEQFEQDESLRGVFADPDFQFSLRDAGRAAVSNDDQHTEDLLVDLLKNRAEHGNEARVRLTTSHAIRAADKLSLDALKGLTGIWALSYLVADRPEQLDSVLESAEDIAKSLLAMGLPEDPRWTEDADALNLVRLSSRGMGALRTEYREFIPRRSHGLPLNTGIDREAQQELIRAAVSNCPWLEDELRPHPLKPGFVLLPGTTREEFHERVSENCHMEPSDLDQLVGLNGFGSEDPVALTGFGRLVDEREDLVEVAAWWDGVPVFDMTLIGRVIGLVNTRRHVEFGGPQTVAEYLEALKTPNHPRA